MKNLPLSTNQSDTDTSSCSGRYFMIVFLYGGRDFSFPFLLFSFLFFVFVVVVVVGCGC